MGPLVVGVRGPGSLATVAWAADRAHDHGLEVVAVHVMEPLVDVPESWMAPWSCDDPASTAEMLANDWCDGLRVRGVPFRTEVTVGGVIPTLCATARRHAASMLVVGRPHRRTFRFVAARMVREATCSIVFVAGFDSLAPLPGSAKGIPAG